MEMRMGITDFFNKVLPPLSNNNNYVLLSAKGGTNIIWNSAYTSIEKLVAAVLKIDQTPTTVYFAIGTFTGNLGTHPDTGKPKVFRKQSMASTFRTLACDVDVGPKYVYQTKKDAAKALMTACSAIKLPMPMLVSSGNGIHAYWPFHETLGAQHWLKLSLALRAALQSQQVAIDPGKVHDLSMVLRPPGSHHKKDPDNWREVKVVRDAPAVSCIDLAKALTSFRQAAPQAAPQAPTRRSSVAAALTVNPVDLDAIRAGCAQVDALLASGGKTGSDGTPTKEPLWRASLGLAKYTTSPEQSVERLCGKHPDYDLQENLDKMDRWSGGPPTCATFAALQPAACAACAFSGVVKSPVSIPTTPLPTTVQAPTGVVTVQLPKRYSTKNGAIYYTPPDGSDPVLISPYEMYIVSRVADREENRQTAKILVHLPLTGPRVIEIDVAVIAQGGAELTKALAMKQIYITADPRPLRAYLMTYLKELQKSSPMEYYFKNFGWQPDGRFVLGSKIVEKGNIIDSGHCEGPVKDYVPEMQQKGSLETWSKLTQLFAQPGAEYHGLVFLMMAGSPLMIGSGLASVLVNSYSRESGTGKTITARLGLSVYGKPSKLIRTVNDTDNALYKHFGIMNSVGAYIDELTTMDVERLRALVFTLQEGRERDRVKQTADGFREKATWDMPVFASSNRDMYDLLSTRMSSEAERLRVLQFPLKRLPCFEQSTDIGFAISRALEHNHGVAGPEIVAEIQRLGGPHEVYNRHYKMFTKKYNCGFSGPERFYQTMFVVADAIGDIMSRLGLLRFNYRETIRVALEYIRDLRTNGTGHDDVVGVDLLSQFLNEHADKVIHYRERHIRGEIRRSALDPLPRVAVARTEMTVDDKGALHSAWLAVNTMALKQWLVKVGGDYRSLIDGMRDDRVAFTRVKRIVLWKGIPGAGTSGQTRCLYVDMLSTQRLREMCKDNFPEFAGKPTLVVVNNAK
jgi:hypothetical protein